MRSSAATPRAWRCAMAMRVHRLVPIAAPGSRPRDIGSADQRCSQARSANLGSPARWRATALAVRRGREDTGFDRNDDADGSPTRARNECKLKLHDDLQRLSKLGESRHLPMPAHRPELLGLTCAVLGPVDQYVALTLRRGGRQRVALGRGAFDPGGLAAAADDAVLARRRCRSSRLQWSCHRFHLLSNESRIGGAVLAWWCHRSEVDLAQGRGGPLTSLSTIHDLVTQMMHQIG